MHKIFFRLTVFIVFHACSSSLFGQNINPGKGPVFNPSHVAIIRVTMNESEKEWLLDDDNKFNNEYLKCNLHFKNANIDEKRTDVGIRIRGNTSRSHAKKSFKFKFTEWDGAKFYGHKKFNLKATNNDPTLVREHMSLAIYRCANVPAARSHYCRLYINNEFMGVYTNIEQIDDEFIDMRFGSEAGNLYKCTWGASLEQNNNVYDNGVFELETNKDLNDRNKLKNFIEILNNTSDANFKTEIEKVLNVENALRFLAVEAIVGHWDGYAYNKNNFYIHENPFSAKIEFIAYDVDNTLGIDWFSKDWGTRDLRNWAHETESRPLHNRLLNVPEFNDEYLKICQEIIEKYFNEKALFWEIDNARDRIKRFVEEDAYYTKTMGFNYNDFKNGFDQVVADHCPYGVKPFISQRVASAIEQIPTISSLNQANALIDLQYFGNGVFQLEKPASEDFKELFAFDVRGRTLPLTWRGDNTFYVATTERFIILKSTRFNKKFVLVN